MFSVQAIAGIALGAVMLVAGIIKYSRDRSRYNSQTAEPSAPVRLAR
jgi:hypothetical protein